MLILADSLPSADPTFGLQLIVWVSVIATLLSSITAILMFFRRRPSLDHDLSAITQRLQTNEQRHLELSNRVDAHIGKVERKLDDGTELHRSFASQQSANAATLLSLVREVSDLSSRIGDMPHQIISLIKPTKH